MWEKPIKKMKKPLVLTNDNFKSEVIKSEMPVLVDFWSSWCPPCKMMESILDEIAGEYGGVVKVGKINVDQNPKIASQFSVQGLPTFSVFKGGKVISSVTGAQSKEQLNLFLESANITLARV